MVRYGALLVLTAAQTNDRVGLIVCTDRVERYVPPGKGRRHALQVLRDPPRVRRIPLGPPGQVLDLPRIRQHALEPLSLQPVKDRLPVIGGRLHPGQLHLPAPHPVRQLQHPAPGSREIPDLLRPPLPVLLRFALWMSFSDEGGKLAQARDVTSDPS